jgi:hypothetical protein
MTPGMTEDERALAAMLTGHAGQWAFPGDDPAFFAALAKHGILPLVARQVRRGVVADVPSGVRQGLARAAVQQAAVEEVLARELRAVLDSLASAGVPVLLIKGTSIAYTHYPYPCLRPRTDSDLVIREGDVATASRVFAELGYQTFDTTRADFVQHQVAFFKTDRLGCRHVCDVHWKIAARKSVSDVLAWDELTMRARSVEPLGPHARTISDVDALLLACVHRMAHHYDNRRLIWLYDIHLLASSLDAASRDAFVQLAHGKGVGAMCLRGLELARERFRTVVPSGLGSAQDARDEPSRVPFGEDVPLIATLAADLRALRGWQARTRLLREHLFPPAAYMRRQYRVRYPMTLPAAYVYRIASGALKWLGPARRSDPFA